MAWVTEYDLKWTSDLAEGKIDIMRDNGSYQQGLTLKKNSLKIRQRLPGWDSQIFRMSCSFTIINDLSDYWELLPLMTISAGQLKVVVTQTSPDSASHTLFEGYMNPETVSQSLFAKAPITLTASGMISKLEYDYPSIIDTIQNMSLIDILDDCLVITGSSYNIRVNCRIYESTAGSAGNTTAFNRTGVSTEIFWKNNVDRMSGLEIIEAILAPFNCYLFWYDSYWWIESYEDIDYVLNIPQPTKFYTEYVSGTSAGYGFSDTGGAIQFPIGATPNVHDPNNRPQYHPNQKISVIPGCRQIDVRLNQATFFNFFNPDLTNTVLSGFDEPTPDYREWHALELTGPTPIIEWKNLGESKDIISNSIQRDGEYSGASGYGFITGLTTRFKITARDDTSLTIKFKFAANFASTIPNPADYVIRFYWYLRTINDEYFHQGESSGVWEWSPGGSPETHYNVLEVSASNFSEDYPNAYEGTLNVPIGDIISELSSFADTKELDLIFRMGTEEHMEVDEPSTADSFYIAAWYGDFVCTISESLIDNLIRGDLNTDFLDKRSISLDLFDTGSWSYRNSLLYGSDWGKLTEEWTRGDSVTLPLVENLLQSKFRLYNVARQKLSISYRSREIFKPLQIWEDDKQSDKPFVLASDTYLPEQDRHDVELWEYDGSTEINLL